MRILVCGGRDYSDREAAFRALDTAHAKKAITQIIEGGALGADRMAREWAIARGIPVRTVEADWAKHGKAAGPMRNTLMLSACQPDGAVAFPGGRGTRDMVAKCEAAQVKVWKPYGLTPP